MRSRSSFTSRVRASLNHELDGLFAAGSVVTAQPGSPSAFAAVSTVQPSEPDSTSSEYVPVGHRGVTVTRTFAVSVLLSGSRTVDENESVPEYAASGVYLIVPFALTAVVPFGGSVAETTVSAWFCGSVSFESTAIVIAAP